jgi:VWFA-related protein
MRNRGRASIRVLLEIFSACLLAGIFLPGQDKPQESVTVTAVEIPVRVFDANGFVAGLTKDDFEVHENGVKQDITGFEAVSRSILPDSVEAPGAIPKMPRERNFLLIFDVFAYTEQIGEAIDFFFKNVYGPGDRFVTLVNEEFVQIKGGGSGEEIAAHLKELLLKVRDERRQEFMRSFQRLERQTESLRRALVDGDKSSEYSNEDDVIFGVTRYYDDYQRAWNDYRTKRLSINLDLYKSIAGRFGKLDGDKWAICFHQRDIFPKIKSGSRLDEALRDLVNAGTGVDPRAGLLEAKQREIEHSLDINDGFSEEKIRELFTQANITFYTLLMKAVSLEGRYTSEDMDLREVRAGYEDTLRKISRDTGGLLIFSNKVLETLKEAAAKHDQYYLIVYQPKKGLVSPENKIDVRVRRDNVHIVSLKTRMPVKTEGITIFDFESGPHSIAFRLKNYARAPLEWKEQGRAMIKVMIFDDQSAKVFSKETTMDLVADTIRLSLNLALPAVSGDYFVLIEAYDIVSGEKAVFSQAVRFE